MGKVRKNRLPYGSHTLSFPLESADHPVDVLTQIADNRLHGVVVGDKIEIEGPANEVGGAVGEVKLKGSGYAFAIHLDQHAIDLAVGVDDETVVHAVGLLQMLGDHGVDVLKILAKIAIHILVGQVDGGLETGHLHVDPVLFLRREGVVGDHGVFGSLEGITAEGVHFYIVFFRKVDTEITFGLGQRTVGFATRR